MAEEEYEILPHKLLADLKYDVEALKKREFFMGYSN